MNPCTQMVYCTRQSMEAVTNGRFASVTHFKHTSISPKPPPQQRKWPHLRTISHVCRRLQVRGTTTAAARMVAFVKGCCSQIAEEATSGLALQRRGQTPWGWKARKRQPTFLGYAFGFVGIGKGDTLKELPLPSSHCSSQLSHPQPRLHRSDLCQTPPRQSEKGTPAIAVSSTAALQHCLAVERASPVFPRLCSRQTTDETQRLHSGRQNSTLQHVLLLRNGGGPLQEHQGSKTA